MAENSRSLTRVGWRSVVPLAAALGLGIATVYILRVLIRPVAFLILGITLAEALAPIVERLARRMSRTLAVTIVFLCLAIVVGVMAWVVLPPLVSQAQELGQQAPELIDRGRALFQHWDQRLGGQASRFMGQLIQQIGSGLVGVPLAVVSGLVNLLVVIFLSIYWLLGSPSLLRFTLSFFPEPRRPRTEQVLHDMGQAMGGYVRGAAINALIMGALAWIGLTVLGIKYALALGVLTMLGEPIPYLGPLLAGIPVVGVALLQSVTKALLALGLYSALQQIEGHLLTPNIMKSQTHVPQALVIFALVAGAAVGGLLGVLVALPLAGALRVFVLEVVAPLVRRRMGAPPEHDVA